MSSNNSPHSFIPFHNASSSGEHTEGKLPSACARHLRVATCVPTVESRPRRERHTDTDMGSSKPTVCVAGVRGGQKRGRTGRLLLLDVLAERRAVLEHASLHLRHELLRHAARVQRRARPVAVAAAAGLVVLLQLLALACCSTSTHMSIQLVEPESRRQSVMDGRRRI